MSLLGLGEARRLAGETADAALQALLVCMLASVIGTFDRTYESEYRAAQCSDMLARIIEDLPRH